MIRNVHSSPRAAATDGSLVRADLLGATLRALEDAAALEELASRHPSHRTTALLERLDAHREILARRAANVALGSVCTAEELSELRDTANNLVAVHGAIARRLGLWGRLS